MMSTDVSQVSISLFPSFNIFVIKLLVIFIDFMNFYVHVFGEDEVAYLTKIDVCDV